MTHFGNIGEFSPEEETFASYSERIRAYFIANDMQDETKKKAILLTVIGAKAYKLLRDLLLPKKPIDCTLDVLTATLMNHYEPAPCEIVERYRFNTCDRQPNQKMTDYIALLRRRSEHCNYGDKLEEQLRDRLVCGVKDNNIQRRLLSEEKLTLKRAVEIAVALEQAESNLATIDSAHNTTPIHKIESSNTTRRKFEYKSSVQDDKKLVKCTGCGNNGHEIVNCRWKKSKCYTCGKLGHLKYKCPQKTDTATINQLPLESDDNNYNRRTHQNEDETIYSMFSVERRNDGVLTTALKFNDRICTFQVDTGAAVSIISEETMKKLWNTSNIPRLVHSFVKLRTFTGELIPVIGKISVTPDNEKSSIELFIVKGSVPSIAGRDLIEQL